MSILISILITFLVIILVLYLINLLPLDGRAKQIVRIIVIIIGVLSLLKYLAVYWAPSPPRRSLAPADARDEAADAAGVGAISFAIGALEVFLLGGDLVAGAEIGADEEGQR